MLTGSACYKALFLYCNEVILLEREGLKGIQFLNACAKMQSVVIGCLQYLTDQSVVIAVSYLSCCDDLMILSERNQSLNPVYVVIQVVLPHFLSSPLYMAIR